MMKILLSAYTGLGNFVLKTPMIQTIKQLYPDAIIDIIAGNGYGTEYLLNNSSLIRKTHILKLDAPFWEKMAFFRKLNNEQYDVLFSPFDAHHNFLLWGALVAQIPHKIRHTDVYHHGIKAKLKLIRKFLFYPFTTFVPVIAGRHEIDLNYDLLESYLNKPVERKKETFVSYRKDMQVLERFDLKPNKYIIIQLGAANGQYNVKVWALKHFIQLITQLQEKYPYKIVLVGDKGDYYSSVKPLLAQLNNTDKIINTANETTINDLMNLIAQARLVICHDSGVMHIADALRKELIALYGPTDYTRTRPLKKSSHILFSKTEHFAAMYNFNTTEAELTAQGVGTEAMEGITVYSVMNTIEQKLNWINKHEEIEVL